MKEIIHIKVLAGDFAENKEIAKKRRIEEILPRLSQRSKVVLDFEGVGGATQSFIHALISDPIRQYGNDAFENLYFKNANADIQKIISIVYRYMQESLDGEFGD